MHFAPLLRALSTLVTIATIYMCIKDCPRACWLFFGLDASTLDDKKVSYIASEINRIWVSSKKSGGIEGWQQQDGLIQALRAVVPGCDPLRPKDNPMNLILPSYETMWRVVFRCLIEVHFRNHPSAPRWQSVLHVFLHTTTPEVFNEVVDDEVSAAAIAKEALRLYPPTRRIYRDLPSGEQHLSLPSSPAPPTSTPQECVRVAANVEALHRDSAHWRGCGISHASNFWPQRWIRASRAGAGRGDGPFLAFGGSLFACPARSEFGPMMVALLVAALLDALPGELEVEDKYAGEMTAGLPLSSDREAYSDLQIVRK
ncbi:cytochrome p450 [Neofusicoccum parvum]|uniref:Cytochrome p450 n=1 Tax=Neofusicoccum parvum TaxID=310453 RepID=A0ACB5SQZ5_9PEZI|nr:cytochrome p450 [Neofusicoccum parvum]